TLRSRSQNQVPRRVNEGQVLVPKADGQDRGVINGRGGIPITFHPIDSALRIEPSIEQIEGLKHFQPGAEKSDAVKRREVVNVPGVTQRRMSRAARRLGTRPKRDP